MKSRFVSLQNLAKKLLAAETASERRALLKIVSKETHFLELAKAVKDFCYSHWTSEPTKAQTSAKVLRLIYRKSPQREIEAYAEWIDGIAQITGGKLSSAAKKLDESFEIFLSLKKNYEAAQTRVARLYALALLGNYDQAVKSGQQALRIFKRHGDDLATGKILHNLGNLFYRRGIARTAKDYFFRARTHFAKAEDDYQLAMIENNLAAVFVMENDFRQAEKFYESALAIADKLKMSVTEAEIKASLGNLALFRGRLDRALQYLETSRRKYEDLKMPHQTAIAELEITDVYLELNLNEEAFSICETVSETLRRLKMRGEEARARANFGRAAVRCGHSAAARRQLKKAARLYLLEKNRSGAATVEIVRATLELTQKNFRAALQAARKVETLLAASENFREKLAVRFIRAEARRELGETTAAAKELQKIFDDAMRAEQPNTAQAAQVALGKIHFRVRNFRRAEQHFKEAIRLTETLRAPLAAEEFRMAFLADKLASFEFLTKIYLAENKFEAAFLLTERARARVLAESIATDFAAEKPTSVLENKLQSLREELNWFYSRLNRAANDAEIKIFQAEAVKHERQIGDLMRQIAALQTSRATRRGGGKADETTRENCTNLQRRLGKENALIEFVNLDGNISAFVVTDEQINFFADLAAESEIVSLLESIQFQFGALRYGADKLGGGFIGDLKKRADFYLQKLREKLFTPLAERLGERDLIVVPIGALHYVPFHALTDGKQYLVETRKIVYAPSATVWSFLASKSFSPLKTALLIGFADERIPFVNREIENLGGCFPRRKIFTGEQATFSAFAENAGNFDVLHFACHGNFRPENPMFSSLHLADGWVTVRDICSQKLKAEIVTLSACETGLHKILAGDEILGLARGFLSAGAKSLILSLWTVNDEATTELMKKFYAELQTGKSAAAALQSAQRDFIERGTHPYFWSPFALIGR